MAWIESHQTLARHPKLFRLAQQLKIGTPQAIGHLHLLWWWALDFAPTGNLAEFSSVEISSAAQWDGDDQVFHAALLKTGWLDEGGEIHDWDDYAGKLIYLRERNKKNQRQSRERHRAKLDQLPNSHRTVTGDTPPSHRLSPGNPTQPNPTQQYQTVPNQTQGNDLVTSGNGDVTPIAELFHTESKKFRKPTVDEVKLHFMAMGLPESEGVSFWSYYQSNGWKVSKNPMKDWKAAAVNWKGKYDERNRGNQNNGAGRRSTGDEIRAVTRGPNDLNKTAYDRKLQNQAVRQSAENPVAAA